MKKKELEETYWKKGSILIDEGKDEEALESLNRALECNTQKWPPFFRQYSKV